MYKRQQVGLLQRFAGRGTSFFLRRNIGRVFPYWHPKMCIRDRVWAYAYNPTHMGGLQVFFQAFENQNTLVNVFNMQRYEVYEKMAGHRITHISATPTFYRLLLPFEQSYLSVQKVTLAVYKRQVS